MRIIYITLFVCILSVFSAAQTEKSAAQKLDDYFSALAQAGEINGNVLVAENGKIGYQKSSGYADFAAKKSNSENSAFQTASVSKVFTATAILQLRDKGKLKLSDAATKFLPDFPFAEITIQHLLSHTSGLPDLEIYEPAVRADPKLVIRNKDVISFLKNRNKPLKFKPGEKWSYANSNYVLLALIIEKTSNLSYPAYLKKFIFEPAGMRDTYVRIAGSPNADREMVKNHILPTMYQNVPQDVEKVNLKDVVRMFRIKYENYNLGATLGDQNVVSTVGDLFKFDQALYSEKLLKSSTLEEAFSPTKLNGGEVFYDDFGVPFGKKCSYGLGWIVCDDPNLGKIAGHDGFNRGIASIFYRNLTKKQTVIMFDNIEGRGFNDKAASAINLLNGKNSVPLELKNSIAREFGTTLLNSNPEFAILRFNELRKDEANYYLDEKEMNLLGYEFLFNGFETQSLEAFKLNVLLFPDSFNVYDSYGEALLKTGKREEAIAMFKKALKINPEYKSAIENLKRAESQK